jgi:hypothetical protein
MERDRYPKNWDLIALGVKEESLWCCQHCGKPCRKPGEAVAAFEKRLDACWLSELVTTSVPLGQLGIFTSGLGQPKVAKYRPKRFLLTVAHLDQNPGNIESGNLQALCAPCHLRYDLWFRGFNRRRKKERGGQMNLLSDREDST